jgi:D-citramalate synthase
VTRFVGDLVRRYPELRFDFHGHDDYGMATANTLAAVEAGATCVHCTVNGMGERAGNTPLDEVVVGIHDFLGRRTRIDETKLITASERVEVFSGRRVAFNKPIVGPNVFTQTAGIHADGDHKGGLYASRLSPERFARRRRYALGKLSGKRSLEFNLTDLGIELDEEQSRLVLERIKELADGKQTITQDDLPFIISDVLETPLDRSFILESCVVVSSFGLKPVATVKVAHRNAGGTFDEYEASSQGDGGYDAFMNAIRSIAGRLGLTLPRLADYNVSIPPGGKSDALVQCSITWIHPERAGEVFNTKGVHSDQVLAAAQATEKMLNLVASGTLAPVYG